MIFTKRPTGLATKLLLGALVGAALPVLGCHKAKTYESGVEITRISPIRKDEAGTIVTSDVEFSYYDCPGTQIEVVRGGKEFSACVQKLSVGQKIKIKLEHHWDPEGRYDYDVYEVEGCARPPDPNDEASSKMVRECADWNVNGTRVGFQCNYQGKAALNKKCPWFVTH